MYERTGRRLQVPDPRDRAGLGLNIPGIPTAPSSGGATGSIVGTAASFVPVVGQFLGPAISSVANLFGKGRREADAQGPVQDAVNNYVKALAAAFGLDWTRPPEWEARLKANPPAASMVGQALAGLRQVKSEYLAFIRDRQKFPDGRSAGQSASAVFPQIDGTGNYGRYATGGSPTTQPKFGFIQGPIPPGGLMGALSRAQTRVVTPTTTAPTPATPGALPGTVSPLGPLFSQPGDYGGESAPWYSVLPIAPSLPTSSSYVASGSGGTGYDPFRQRTAAAPPSGGMGDSLPWLLAGGVVLAAVLSRK